MRQPPPEPPFNTPPAADGVSPEGIDVPHRSPGKAALWSLLFLGGGQVYNKQLEKAILIWIWGALVFGSGLVMLLLGLLDRVLPPAVTRPPLGDWINAHGGSLFLGWLVVLLLLWAANVRDAWVSAGRINRREVRVRYSMRRQMVHVVGSQLLGLIPVVGMFFPPGVVAEALDAVRHRRGPDRARLLDEGRQVLLEWMLTRAAIYAFWAFLVFWLLWWILRGIGVAP